jgi:hypothetical protein
LPLLCPICRYRIHPAHARGWARRYRRALARAAAPP